MSEVAAVNVEVVTEVKVDKRKGFKLGHVWLMHVNAGVGIALVANNFEKLKFTADNLSIKYKKDISQENLAKQLVGKIPLEMLSK